MTHVSFQYDEASMQYMRYEVSNRDGQSFLRVTSVEWYRGESSVPKVKAK
jgi:hypothetical protein